MNPTKTRNSPPVAYMQLNDIDIFSKVMGTLSANFNRPLDKETIDIFFKYLCDLDFRAVKFAAHKIILNEDRFPTVKIFRTWAVQWRKPVDQDLNRPAIAYTPPDLAAERMDALLRAVETGDFSKCDFGCQD